MEHPNIENSNWLPFHRRQNEGFWKSTDLRSTKNVPSSEIRTKIFCGKSDSKISIHHDPFSRTRSSFHVSMFKCYPFMVHWNSLPVLPCYPWKNKNTKMCRFNSTFITIRELTWCRVLSMAINVIIRANLYGKGNYIGYSIGPKIFSSFTGNFSILKWGNLYLSPAKHKKKGKNSHIFKV